MTPDVAVVGTGPNGLAAAVTMARAGLRVELYEAAETIGGGLRGEAYFDSDVRHDVCSAVHPMAAASPFFREFGLPERGVELLNPPVAYAHPLDDGRAGLAYGDLDATCDSLGRDGRAWRRLMAPLLEHSDGLVEFFMSGQRSVPRDLIAPLLLAARLPAHGTALGARDGSAAYRMLGGFRDEVAPALLTGVAAHAVGKLPSISSAAVAMLLGHLAHSTGWPLPRGGSERIAEAMADDIRAHGGVFHTSARVTDLRQFDGVRAVLLDVTPTQLLELGGDRLPSGYARHLRRYHYGPGAAKADFLVDGPVPWTHPEVGRAGTVHLGGTRAAVALQEGRTVRGEATDEPFVLLVDPAVTDPGRARNGKRPVWAYAHVPNGDPRDPVELLRTRIEKYAPGFSDTIVAARGVPAAEYELYNPNYVGGDIGAGAMTLYQSVARPVPYLDPHRTPLPGVFLCSASTPPGPGVHGMSGYLAARSALRRRFGVRQAPSLSPAAGKAASAR